MTLSTSELERIRLSTEAIARGVGVHGLLNIQFALVSDVLYVLEANPRASRTVPFVSKATGVSLAKAAALVMAGRSIADLRAMGILPVDDASVLDLDSPIAVKEAVLPFKRFRTKEGVVVDTVLGPEMRSTGEVMGFDVDFPTAFAKSQDAAFGGLPTGGRAFISVADRDKRSIVFPVKRLAELGFEILATEGTAAVLHRSGIASTRGPQVLVGPRRAAGADDRRPHHRRRGGHRGEHARPARAPAPTATRSARRRPRPTRPWSPPCSSSARRCRRSRRARPVRSA